MVIETDQAFDEMDRYVDCDSPIRLYSMWIYIDLIVNIYEFTFSIIVTTSRFKLTRPWSEIRL